MKVLFRILLFTIGFSFQLFASQSISSANQSYTHEVPTKNNDLFFLQNDFSISWKDSNWLNTNPYQFVNTSDFQWNVLKIDTDATELSAIHNQEKTKAPKPTLILLHGGGTWSYSFRNLIPLLNSKFQIFAIDIPGFGLSRPLYEKFKNYSMENFNKNFQELLKKITPPETQVSLLGHSWGGGLAIGYTLNHPDQVDHLVLISSSGLNIPDTWDWELFRIKGVGRLFTFLINPLTVKMDLKKAFYDNSYVDSEMIFETYWPLKQSFTKKAIYYYSQNFNWKWTEKRLSNIQQKTLIAWGRQDKFMKAKHAFTFKEKIPNSTIAIFDQCGHQIHEECSEPVADFILKFW